MHENTYRPIQSRTDGKWYVLDDFDECVGGPYDTKEEAVKAFGKDRKKKQS